MTTRIRPPPIHLSNPSGAVGSFFDFDMIVGYSPSTQALLGSLFTWFVTALGAACVFLFRKPNQKLLGKSGFVHFRGGGRPQEFVRDTKEGSRTSVIEEQVPGS